MTRGALRSRAASLALATALATALAAALAGTFLLPATARGQEVRVGDLTLTESAVPHRVVGYGLVVGLDGTGDRALGGYGAVHTVRSVANLLRNFSVEVPAEMLRMRNVAAVLVTAELSPYLRAGGRFEVQIASVGDAQSLKGGVLWITPLVAEAGGQPVATAQGPILISGDGTGRMRAVATSARIPDGGLLAMELPRPDFAAASHLLVREPSLGTASRIAAAINASKGEGTASVEDPGAVALRIPQGEDHATFLSEIADLRVTAERRAQLVIDRRNGTVVAGGGLVVGEAVVSHGGMTLTIGGNGAAADSTPGGVRVAPGTSVQDVAAALHAIAAPPTAIAAIFESLRSVGALSAEVVVR